MAAVPRGANGHRAVSRADVPQHVVMQVCEWKTEAMFRRYAIVKMRVLGSAVELLAKGTTEAQSEGRRCVQCGKLSLSCCPAKCPGRDSNPHEVTLKGF
jgi:hypothetical protein